MFKLPRSGETVLLGGSVARVFATGTIYPDHRTPTPVVMVLCPDYTDELIRLVGERAISCLGPVA